MTDAAILLCSDEAAEVAGALQHVERETIGRLERFVDLAVHGRRPAIRGYVREWLRLQRSLLELVELERPGTVTRSEDGALSIAAAGQAAEVITQGAFQAPFSPWVVSFGPGTGVALHLLSEIRRALGDAHPLIPEGPLVFPLWDVGRSDIARFMSKVWDELHVEDPLEAIASTFAMGDTDLARLFGVTRQAVAQWSDEGIPATRMERVHSVQRIADVLRREVRPERIGAVIRTVAPAYGDRSILGAIAAGDARSVLETLERTFDWAGSA